MQFFNSELLCFQQDNKNILNIHGAGLPGQHGQQSQQQQPKSSISGMLSDFTKALGTSK